MSRGQKPRTPQHFPKMKYRACKRDFRRIQREYGIVLVRRWNATELNGWMILGHLTAAAWETPDAPFDASAWLDGVR